MNKKYPYLKDYPFLKEFDAQRKKKQYVKIIVLNFNEKPIKEIQGKVISGNLNLDGKSNIRRTCNIQLIADEKENSLTDVENLLSINKKIQIFIGYSNNTKHYIDFPILWFPIGIFVIIDPNISNNSNGVSISLQIKDKMCLLNGECGGSLPASVTFHEYETLDENGEYVITKPTIYKIIQELVNHFGGEQLSKIIISDIDSRIKQVIKWTGSTPLYIIRQFKDNKIQYTPTTNIEEAATVGTYNTYNYGEDIGYIYTDFTYPGELIGDIGNSVCDILDKIKSILGNYEYFYDVEGNFIFQEVKNYLNTSYAKVEIDKLNKNNYMIDIGHIKNFYDFDDNILITSFSNTPKYSMIKNDFIVWGIRKTTDNAEIPIRYHLAIDKKPKIGNTYKVYLFTDKETNLVKAKVPMNFSSKLDFPKTGQAEIIYYDLAKDEIYYWDTKKKEYVLLNNNDFKKITTTDWRTELYLSGAVTEPLGLEFNHYYTELKEEWPKLYDIENGNFKEKVLKNQNEIDFFLDFIDTDSEISKLSIQNIGRRTKIIVDNSINCIFEPEIPDLVLLNSSDPNIRELREECERQGQDYIQLSETLFSMTAMGGNFNSAYNLIRELLYQYTSYNESISINSVPIFYLEPNTRIAVRDTKSGIYGDYIINNISIPFDVNGTMSLSCTRTLERI